MVAAVQTWLESGHALSPCEAHNANKNGFVNKRDKDCSWLQGKHLGGNDPHTAHRRITFDQGRQSLGPILILTGIDNYSGVGFRISSGR